MATRDGYDLSVPENIEIKSVDDIEKMLVDNNIIPTYEGHLEHVNTCINLFTEMENNRTCKDIFCDFAAGERSKINCGKLLHHLKKVKKELMTGMTLYRRLCQQKEQVKNLFETLNIKKFKLDKKDVEVRAMSPVKELAKFGITVGVAGALGATGAGVCAGLLVHYGILAVTLGGLTSTMAVTAAATGGIGAGLGLSALGGAAAAVFIIYKIAQYKGKERGLKYQQVKELYDRLEEQSFFNEVQTNNLNIRTIFDAIDSQLHAPETNLLRASNVYSKAKEKALKELANTPGMTDEIRATISEREATLRCEDYFYKFDA